MKNNERLTYNKANFMITQADVLVLRHADSLIQRQWFCHKEQIWRLKLLKSRIKLHDFQTAGKYLHKQQWNQIFN
jgi:hypothetical protein